MKYEIIFGDEALFDGAPDHVEVLRFNDYSKEYLWGDLNTAKLLTFKELKAIPIVAMRRIEDAPYQHSDDLHVDNFAHVMKQKLSKCREKGRGGWEECPIEFLNSELIRHINKGDPVDVANFAMMIHERNEKIKRPEPKRWTWEDKKAGWLPEVGCKCVGILSEAIKRVVHVNKHIVAVENEKTLNVCNFTHEEFFRNHKPIETPAEKAQREEDEFVESTCRQNEPHSTLYSDGVRAAYRKLKGG